MRNLIQKNQTQKKQHKQSDIFMHILLGVFALVLMYFAFKIFAMSFAISEATSKPIPESNEQEIVKIIEEDIEETEETNNQETESSMLNESLLLDYTPQRKKLIEGLVGYSLGTDNPKITIVEFSDFACPYCKEQYSVLRQLAVMYKDDIKIIFRDRPGFDDSIDLAMSAQCAGEQGKFWELHDSLFVNQSAILKNKGLVLELANRLNIDIPELVSCIENEKHLTTIKKSFSDSETLGVTGTPTFFINGEKIEGQQTLAEFEEMIQKLLTN